MNARKLVLSKKGDNKAPVVKNDSLKNTPKSILDSYFKNKDKVILIENKTNKIFFGELEIFTNSILLRREKNEALLFKWSQIFFLSHDGLPIRTLFEKEDLIKNTKSKNTEKTIELILENSACTECGAPFIKAKNTKSTKCDDCKKKMKKSSGFNKEDKTLDLAIRMFPRRRRGKR